MKVFIANFGRENYAWAECLARGTIATMNDEAVHPFWVAGDRDGYINYSLANTRTAAGITPTKPVASRWFNLMTVIAESSGDIWFHREKDQIWWTESKAAPPTIALEPDPFARQPGGQVYVCHKPCEPWSNTSRLGNRLQWQALHKRAREFLFTEGTLQQLQPDNAAYALALIAGDDLSAWHDRPDWKRKEAGAERGAATIFNARQKSIAIMAMTARDTCAGANGQEVTRTMKNKELRFSAIELEAYLDALLTSQEGLCAITDLPLQFKGDERDPALLCSLDRIDSDGHYEAGNLQIVCRFVNRWKSDSKDAEFRRLVGLVRRAEI